MGLVGLALVLAAGFWLGFAELLRRSIRTPLSDLPDLPDLTAQPAALAEHVRLADLSARRNRGSAEAIGALGMAYHADELYDHALRCYTAAAALNRQDWRWKYHASLVHEELGQAGAAAEALREALRWNPGHALAWLRLGHAELKQGHPDEAGAAFRQSLAAAREAPSGQEAGGPEPGSKTFPLEAYASLGLARAALERGRSQEARRLLQSLAAAYPTFSPARRLLGQLHGGDGSSGDAGDGAGSSGPDGAGIAEDAGGDAAGESAALEPGAPSYLPPADPMVDALARISRKSSFLLKQKSLAMLSLNAPWGEYLARRAVAVNGDDADAVAELALLLIILGRPDEAQPFLRQYRGMTRDDYMTLNKLGHWLCVAGKASEGIVYFQDALRINPRCSEAHGELGLALAKLGKVEEGLKHCQEAIRIEPRSADAHYNLGTMQFRAGNLDEAIDHLQEAIRIRPDHLKAHRNLGAALGGRGRFAEARSHLEKALRLRPDSAETLCELATIFAREENRDEARRLFREALRVDPDCARARRGLESLRAEKPGTKDR